jgi:hypothetical protein
MAIASCANAVEREFLERKMRAQGEALVPTESRSREP